MQPENESTRRNNGASAAHDRIGQSSKGRFTALQPRLLNASEAARYLGHQSRTVLKSIPVKPIRLSSDGVGRGGLYDRHALDLYLDEMSGIRRPTAESAPAIDDPQTDFDKWRQARDARCN